MVESEPAGVYTWDDGNRWAQWMGCCVVPLAAATREVRTLLLPLTSTSRLLMETARQLHGALFRRRTRGSDDWRHSCVTGSSLALSRGPLKWLPRTYLFSLSDGLQAERSGVADISGSSPPSVRVPDNAAAVCTCTGMWREKTVCFTMSSASV